MKYSAFKLLVTLGVVFYGSSCATRGTSFPSDISWIEKTVTKKEDVKNLLGVPFQVGYASGKPTWIYGYYQYRLFGASHTKELKFYWNRDGTVSNFAFTSSFPDDVNQGTSPTMEK